MSYHLPPQTPARVCWAAIIAVILLGNSGCHYQITNVIREHLYLSTSQYYNCPRCGHHVPKGRPHDCKCNCDPGYAGFQATCWRAWPADWNRCPAPGAAEPCGNVGQGIGPIEPIYNEMPLPQTTVAPPPVVAPEVPPPAPEVDKKPLMLEPALPPPPKLEPTKLEQQEPTPADPVPHFPLEISKVLELTSQTPMIPSVSAPSASDRPAQVIASRPKVSVLVPPPPQPAIQLPPPPPLNPATIVPQTPAPVLKLSLPATLPEASQVPIRKEVSTLPAPKKAVPQKLESPAVARKEGFVKSAMPNALATQRPTPPTASQHRPLLNAAKVTEAHRNILYPAAELNVLPATSTTTPKSKEKSLVPAVSTTPRTTEHLAPIVSSKAHAATLPPMTAKLASVKEASDSKPRSTMVSAHVECLEPIALGGK